MVPVQHEPMETSDEEEQQFGASSAAEDSADDDAANTSTEEVASASATPPTKASQSAKSPTHTLHLRFHRKPTTAAAVQLLDAAISAVRLPRQKNARHCLVDFSSASAMQEAAERLRAVSVDGHKLVVSQSHSGNPVRVAQQQQLQSERHEQRAVLNRLIGAIDKVVNTDAKRAVTNGVYIRGLPRDIRRPEVEAAFPNALEVRVLLHERADKGAGASVELPSPADALKARKSKVTIREVAYRPEFQRDGTHSVRLAKRLASRGQTMGPARYFMRRDGRKGANEADDGEVKEEDEEEQDVVNEIMNVYN